MRNICTRSWDELKWQLQEKNSLISAGEGTRQSSVESEGKWSDKKWGRVERVLAVFESLSCHPVSLLPLLATSSSLFLWINKLLFLASKPSLDWISITCNQKSFNSIKIQNTLRFHIPFRENPHYLTFSYNALVWEKGWQKQFYQWILSHRYSLLAIVWEK